MANTPEFQSPPSAPKPELPDDPSKPKSRLETEYPTFYDEFIAKYAEALENNYDVLPLVNEWMIKAIEEKYGNSFVAGAVREEIEDQHVAAAKRWVQAVYREVTDITMPEPRSSQPFEQIQSRVEPDWITRMISVVAITLSLVKLIFF